ncbi:MAG: CapA family protein [candidate division WOR-3 bacterium]
MYQLLAIFLFLLLTAGSTPVTSDNARQLDTTRPLPVEPEPQPVVISWVGDIHLGQSVGEMGLLKGMDYVLADVSDSLLSDSLTVGNLECSASTIGRAEKGKEYTFQAPPGLLPGLRENGIELVSLANNHALDFGKPAMLEMLDHLRSAGLLYAGAGPDIRTASAPVYVTIAGQTVAILCFSRVVPAGWQAGRTSPGIAGCLAPRLLLERIAEARDSADIVAVYVHWGKEKMSAPEDYVRLLAYRCVEAGADLVVGSHPHVLRGFEFYQGRLIAYSLGNFVFTNRDGRASMILRTAFLGDSLVSASVVPCRINMLRPELETNEAGRQDIFRHLTAISVNAVVDSSGTIRLRD